MTRCRFLFALIVPAALGVAARAGGPFDKDGKSKPGDPVPQLIVTIKSDQDESKRINAAKELRHYDPSTYTEMVPVLVEVLQNDKSAGVRAEAASSLSKLRPVNPQAGAALEAALHDSSIKVRWTARNSLMLYRINGYRSAGKLVSTTPAPAQTEPDSHPLLSRLFGKKPGSPAPEKTSPGESSPPPLAQPGQVLDPLPASPMPISPVSRPIPKANRNPTPPPADSGPDLPPGE